MMLKGEDRQPLQTLINNNTTSSEDQLTPASALKAIQYEEHFWHYRDEVMTDFRQQPNE